VKPLADPANLNSDNPAIKAAAEIKTEEDLAPQKIKAIRYLSTIACGCYPQVRPALLAALDDCTEEVRYEGLGRCADPPGIPVPSAMRAAAATRMSAKGCGTWRTAWMTRDA
jgi:hypothetical protein